MVARDSAFLAWAEVRDILTALMRHGMEVGMDRVRPFCC